MPAEKELRSGAWRTTVPVVNWASERLAHPLRDGNKMAPALSLGETPQCPEDDRDGSFSFTRWGAMEEFGIKGSQRCGRPFISA